MPKRFVFAVRSPLGYRITLDRDRWKLITGYKHPALAGKHELLRKCLTAPDVVRESENDSQVHIHYRRSNSNWLCVVVAPTKSTEDRFVVTAYLTRKIKEGREIWTK